MNRLRVLFCQQRFAPGKTWEALGSTILKNHDVKACSADQVEETLQSFKPHVLVPWWHPLPRRIIENAPSSLGLVQQFGVGLDNVDVDACTDNGIWVARLASQSTGNADSVAEHAVLLMMALSRRLTTSMNIVKEGKPYGSLCGTSLMGKRVAVAGLGDIGVAIVKRLQGWGMDIVAVRKNVNAEIPHSISPDTIPRVYSLDELPQVVSNSDFTVCAIKYDRKENRHLFGTELFSKFNGSTFINIARGGLVDETALYQALENGSVGQAGLDVFEKEPLPISSPLQSHPNVILTGHNAGVTDLFYEQGTKAFARNCDSFANGQLVQFGVNRPTNPRVHLL
ncbi:hypothetical protein NQZ79_g6568 [Umbelopsis isabellina]|nr:hypothetical protein NQZ79_g6568 [Umbelopsis isabellina]